MFEKQLVMTRELYGERFTTVFMRKMAAFYVKGMRGAAVFKDRLFKSENPDEVLEIASKGVTDEERNIMYKSLACISDNLQDIGEKN